MERHIEAVARLASDVRSFYDRKESFRVYHGSTNSTRQLKHRRDKVIDTSKLTNIIQIDRDNKTVSAEPNVSMDALIKATLEQGLLPPVVMEFPGITVGGGFSGTAGESSSFKCGLFDCTVTEIEMVLGDGSVVTASESERSDLFFGAAGSCGTLGVVTLLKLDLIEAKRYVELMYHPVSTTQEALDQIERAAQDPSIDYLDGIVFSLDHSVVMTGRLTDDPRKTVLCNASPVPAIRGSIYTPSD